MSAKVTLTLISLTLAILTAGGQAPTPIVVQPIGPGATTAAPPAAILPAADPGASALKSLLEIKTANEEILRKQVATLLQLEEMEKAAEQIKIYTKRG